MSLRRREYLVENKYKIGFSWDAPGGKRKIVGNWKDGRFAVSKPDGSNTFDILPDSDIDFEIKKDASRLKTLAAKEIKYQQAVADKNQAENTHGFADKFPAHQRAKILKALNKGQHFNRKYMTRKEYIHDAVRGGATIGFYKSERILENPSRSFMSQTQLSKTGMDYADFLIKNKVKV